MIQDNILKRIVNQKQIDVRRAKQAMPIDALLRAASGGCDARQGSSGSLLADGMTRDVISMRESILRSASGIIAEFKRRSPSKGEIHPNPSVDAADIAAGYERAGAAAISVLTDGTFFGGSSLDFVAARRAAAHTPMLRKEFIIDEYQIFEARAMGADAILLIAAILDCASCRRLAATAHSLGLEVLLELHDPTEIGHVGDHTDMVGVNNRNLGSFVTSLENSVRMAPLLPSDLLRVSESGIGDPATVRALRGHGYRGFLMGENFMKTDDPAAALAQFINQI